MPMPSRDVLQTLFLAAANGDEKAITKLLAQDSSLLDATNAKPALSTAVDEELNYSALDWATCQGHRNLVVQILAKWPDLISVQNAARGGYDEVLNVVFSRNPQPLSKTAGSRTALIAAVTGGHESTVTLLLAKDPELIHVVNLCEQTALHCAKKVSIAKRLVDHTPELIGALDSRGRTALHSAVLLDCSIEMIDLLLGRRPELSDVVDADHQNALHLAVRSGHKEAFFRLLAQNPRSIDVLTLENRNVLHLAAQAGNPQVLDAVLSLRPEFACGVDTSGNTALHWLFRGLGRRHNLDESFWEKIWQLKTCALRALNEHSQTPSMIAIGRAFLREKELSLTQKLSWDDLISDHEVLKLRRRDLSERLNTQLQVSRKFAEDQCESGLSSVLFIPGVIDIVKSYFLAQEEVEKEDEPNGKRHKGEPQYWHWDPYYPHTRTFP